MRERLALVWLCLMSVVIGCSSNDGLSRLDGSSQEDYEASLQAVRAELGPAELSEFNQALVVVGMAGENLVEAAGDPEAALARARGRLDGMTAAEVITRADELKAGR